MAKLRNGALYIRVSTADQTELSPDVNITVRRSRQSGVARATCPD